MASTTSGMLCVLAAAVALAAGAVIKDADRCTKRQACGWEVYRPESFHQNPSYFVYSPCHCGEKEQCVPDSEDLAISSIIYRCKAKSDTDTQLHEINVALGTS